MQKTTRKQILSLILCITLIAAMALFTTGCNDNTTSTEAGEPSLVSVTVMGEGKTKFDFSVTHADGSVKNFKISTDKETVGDALLEQGLIAGDDSQYGLYVKTVDGETLDYDTHGKYWAFYENDQYATAGVDTTVIKEGVTYAFKAEKA